MNRYTLFFLLLLLAQVAEAEIQWPLSDPELNNSFTSLTPYILLSSDSKKVVAMTDAVVLFIEKERDFSTMPRPLGGYVLLEHADSFFSFYAGCDPVIETRTIDIENPSVGVLDGNGYSYVHRLLFAIFDHANRTWINPLLFLPESEDKSKVNISSVDFQWEEEDLRAENGGKLTVVFDTETQGYYAPYRIRLDVGEIMLFDYSFDTAVFSEELFSLRTASPFSLDIPLHTRYKEKKAVITAWTFSGDTVTNSITLRK